MKQTITLEVENTAVMQLLRNMADYIHGRYGPMETALKKVGLKVVCAEKHGKKIVITVTRYEARKKVI